MFLQRGAMSVCKQVNMLQQLFTFLSPLSMHIKKWIRGCRGATWRFTSSLKFLLHMRSFLERFKQHLWQNALLAYNGKAACRPNIKSSSTVLTGKNTVPKMTHRMELKTQILPYRLLHLIVESLMHFMYTCRCVKWLAVNQCNTSLFACVGHCPCFTE